MPKIIIGIVIIVAVAAGGYFFLQKNNQATPLPIPGLEQTILPKATEKDFDFTQDPILKKHLVAQANKSSYRTKTVSPGSGLTTVNEIQITGTSFKSREIESDGLKERKHIIIIGDTTYLKDYSDGKWWKQTLKPEETKEEEEAPEKPKDFKEEYTKPNLTFKSLGKEACGNLNCYKYEQTMPETPDVKRVFWFDDKEYLLRKEQGGYGEFIVTVEYSYAGIDIKAPSPIKDVPAGKNIYDYLSPQTNFPVPDTNLPQMSQPSQSDNVNPDEREPVSEDNNL